MSLHKQRKSHLQGPVSPTGVPMASSPVKLEALIRRFPREWAMVRTDTMDLLKRGRPEELHAYIQAAKQVVAQAPGKSSAGSPQVIKAHLGLLVVEKQLRAVLAGSHNGQLELSKRDLFLAQKIFFTRQRERRLPRVFWFKLAWRLIANKTGVMSLIQSLGIYCVFSRDLVAALVSLIGTRVCLEMGAGDGTLSLALGRLGVKTIAIDDKSWGHKIKYPDWVEKIDAKAALQLHRPQAVICSWPPPENRFERSIFSDPGVDLYIMIGSQHQFASGDWATYAAQKEFSWCADEHLSQLVLPRELESTVLVFRRITSISNQS